MSQGSILTDMFLNTSSSLGALMSQVNGALVNGSLAGQNFSSLLSNEDVFANTLPQTTVPPDPTALATQPNPVASMTSSSGSLLQNMQDLSGDLHKIMNILRQTTHRSSTTTEQENTRSLKQSSSNSQTAPTPYESHTANVPNGGTSATSNKSNPSQSASKNSTSSTASDAVSGTLQSDGDTTSNQTSSSNDPSAHQTLEALIAELMLITQLVIKNIEHTQKGASDSPTIAPSPDSQIEGGLSDLQNMLEAIDGKTSAQDGSSEGNSQVASSSDPSQSNASADSLPDLLQKLVALLDKTSKQITDLTTGMTQGQNNPTTQQNDSISSLIASDPSLTQNIDLASQLAAIEERIKIIFSLAQKQNMDGTAAQTGAPTPSVVNSGITTGTSPGTKFNTSTTTSSSVVPDTSTLWNAVSTQNQTDTMDQSTGLPVNLAALSAKETGNMGADTGSQSSMHGGMAEGNFDTTSALSGGGTTTNTTNFADHLSSLRMIQSTPLAQPNPVDQAILQINRGLKNGNDQMSLQLHPSDLGKITVKLDFSNDGKVQGTVTADNPKTLEMLQKDSRSLERALQDAGLRADPGSLSFNLGNQSGQNSSQTAAGNNDRSNEKDLDGTITAEESTELGTDLASIETYYVTPNGVNIRV